MTMRHRCENKQKKRPFFRNSFTLKFNSQFYLFLLIKSFCVFALFVVVVLALIIASNENSHSHWKEGGTAPWDNVLFKVRKKRNITDWTMFFRLVFVSCCSRFGKVSSKLSLNSYHFKSFFRFYFLFWYSIVFRQTLIVSVFSAEEDSSPSTDSSSISPSSTFGVFFLLHSLEWRNAFVNLCSFCFS